MSQLPALVIGGGFGGLAAAVRLRARGYPVILLEANEQLGGRASVFRAEGFTFDGGPTVITAPYLFDELFALVGRRASDYFEMMPVDPFYRVLFPGGEQFDYVGDEERLLAQIEGFHRKDVDGYRRLAAHAKRVFDIGYLKLADTPFERLSDMLRVVPDLVKLESYRTVYSLVSKYLEDERLRQVFTFQPLLIGGNPFQTTSIYLLIHWLERAWGVHFARGGTGAIVAGFARLLEEIGVDVRLDTPVEHIVVEDGRAKAVVTEAGQRIDCALVVSNADPTVVYGRMIDRSARRWHTDASLRRRKQSMSLFVSYFGTNKRFDALKHHTIVLGPRYQGLLDDIFNKKILADDFSLYLHRPTRSDPSLAPEGCDAFYVLSPVPNERSGVDWSEEGELYQERILSHLEARLMPGLRDSVVTKFFVDPRYFQGRLRSADGAAFGPEPLLRQSAWFRFHNRSEDVDGLYFVGAGTHPGAGVPGVLSGAKVLDHVVPAPDVPQPLPDVKKRRSAA